MQYCKCTKTKHSIEKKKSSVVIVRSSYIFNFHDILPPMTSHELLISYMSNNQLPNEKLIIRLTYFFFSFHHMFLTFFFIFSGFSICITSAQNDCAPSAMSKCTDPLKVVTDNKDLGFATSKEELVKMCP